MKNPMFPTPDIAHTETKTMAVEGARVIQAMISETHPEVVLLSLAQEGDHILGFRFALPSHKRTARKLFQAGGFKQVPYKTGNYPVSSGVFLIDFEGTVIGEDTVPEGSTGPDGDLTKIYVMENVKAVVRDFIPEEVVPEPEPALEPDPELIPTA